MSDKSKFDRKRLLALSAALIFYSIFISYILKMTISSYSHSGKDTAIEYDSKKLPPPPNVKNAKVFEKIKDKLIEKKQDELIDREKPFLESATNNISGNGSSTGQGTGDSTGREALTGGTTGFNTADNIPGTLYLPTGKGNNFYGDFALRSSEGRKAALVRGGSSQTESAVTKALNYLKTQQNQDGSWGEANSENQVALSGLAMLAFFAHGETPDSQEYGKTVLAGLKKMIEFSKSPGIEKNGNGFGHAILAYALSEASGLIASGEVVEAMNQRIAYIVKHQNSFGSFNYNYDNQLQQAQKDLTTGKLKKGVIAGEPRCDLSFTGWNIQALKAAWSAGCDVPKLSEALLKSIDALIEIHRASGGGFSFCINGGKYPGDPEVTPVGAYCLQILGEGKNKLVNDAINWLKRYQDGQQLVPAWNSGQRFPLYVWYYQTMMLFNGNEEQSRLRQRWNRELTELLTNVQKKDGSWRSPNAGSSSDDSGENNLVFKKDQDYAIYCTSLCTLMLEVYYRYRPTKSLEESRRTEKGIFADIEIPGLNLLLVNTKSTRLQILKTGRTLIDWPSDIFKVGQVNGKPKQPGESLVRDEFKILRNENETVQVRNPRDFPQHLLPNQRIAIFLSKVPKTIYGGLILRVAVGCDTEVHKPVADTNESPVEKNIPKKVEQKTSQVVPEQSCQSLQILWNRNLIWHHALLTPQNLVNAFISNNLIDSGENVLEIRNMGSEPVSFDAFKIYSGESDVPVKLNIEIDSDSKNISNQVFHLSQDSNFKEPLPLITESCLKNKYKRFELNTMGTLKCEWQIKDSFHGGISQQTYYLYKVPRDIVEWLWGGGSEIILRGIFEPGEIYYSEFGNKKLAWYGLKRVLKLFAGDPRALTCNVIPVDSSQPLYDVFWAAVKNDADNVTVQINSYRAKNQELKVTCSVPWAGRTEVEMITGIMPGGVSFETGNAAKMNIQTKIVRLARAGAILDKASNQIRECGIFEEEIQHGTSTTIRLRRIGAKSIEEQELAEQVDSKIVYDKKSVRTISDEISDKYFRTSLRLPEGRTATEGDNYKIVTVPAIKGNVGDSKNVVPWDSKSIAVSICFPDKKMDGDQGARIFFGQGPADAEYFSFWVYPRRSDTWRTVAKLRFHFGTDEKKYFFETNFKAGEWHQVVIPCDKYPSLSWGDICITGDPAMQEYSDKTPVRFEFNGFSLYSQKHPVKGCRTGLVHDRVTPGINKLSFLFFGEPNSYMEYRYRITNNQKLQTHWAMLNGEWKKMFQSRENNIYAKIYNLSRSLKQANGSKTEDCNISLPIIPARGVIWNFGPMLEFYTKTAGVSYNADAKMLQFTVNFPDKPDKEWLDENWSRLTNVEQQLIIKRKLVPIEIRLEFDKQ